MKNAADSELLARLTDAHKHLAAVLEKRDWERLGVIDQRIRECLQEMAGRDDLSDEILLVKQQLKQLHGQAIKACGEVCENFRQILLTHLDYAEGRSAYLRIDLLRDEK
jgi:hypothetical protein